MATITKARSPCRKCMLFHFDICEILKLTNTIERAETNMVLQNGLGDAKALGATSDSDVDTLIQTMSADKVNGLGSINPSLEEMANSCEPIMTNFDSVLVSFT